MKKLSGFPLWMLFVFTCFLNWAAILTAGIITGNKKWIIIGIAYAMPVILVFGVAINDKDMQQRAHEKQRITTGMPLSVSERAKFGPAIEANKQIVENMRIISAMKDTLNNKNRAEIRLKKTHLKAENRKLKKKIDENLKAAYPDNRSWFENFAITLWVLASLAAFVHAWIIKPKYWAILREKERTLREQNAENHRFAIKNPEQNFMHSKILQEVKKCRQEIIKNIETTKNLDTYLRDDILRMTNNFSKQINILIEKDKELTLNISPSGAKNAKKQLDELKTKLENTEDAQLYSEIQTAIDAKQKLYTSYKEMQVKHDTIKLRLQTAVASLKQVQLDLIKLENVFNTEQKKEFFANFEEKASELSNYVSAIEESYE